MRDSRPTLRSLPLSGPAGAIRLRRTRLIAAATLAAGATAGAAIVLPGLSTAAASPTIKSVEARIAAINVQAEKITEAYDGARSQLSSLQGKAKATHETLQRDQQVLAGMQGKIARMAAAAYETAGLTGATTLLEDGSPQVVMDKASDLGEVAKARSSELSQALAANRAVESDQVTYNAEVTAERKTLASIASKRSQIQALLGKEQQVLSGLKAAQRRAIAAAQARERARALAERQAHAAEAAAPTQHATYHGPASGSAAAAVQFAYAQLGKPYVYGGTGPDSYDCSGLTMRSWEAGGVSLPRTAAEQQSAVPAVSLSALQPGDLVFFGVPAYHVAIYIGGGRIIQAPHTGADVEITPLSYMTPSGAGRP